MNNNDLGNLLYILSDFEGELQIQNVDNTTMVSTADGKKFEVSSKDYDPNSDGIANGIIEISDGTKTIKISTKDISSVAVSQTLGEETFSFEKKPLFTSCKRKNENNENKIFESAFSFLSIGTSDKEKIKRSILLGDYDSAHHSYDGGMPLMLEHSALEYMTTNGHISAEKGQQINQQGFVFSKAIVMNDENNNSTILTVCCIFESKKNFDTGAKPDVVEISFSNQTKEIKEPDRKIIYCLGTNGTYENIGVDLSQFSKSTVNFSASPLNFDVLIEYIKKIGLSIGPSRQFQEIYNNDIITDRLQSNFNIIRSQIEEIKYTEFLTQDAARKLEAYRQSLAKKYQVNVGSKTY